MSDPRLTLARGALASAALRDVVHAEHYLHPEPRVCRADSAPIRAAPQPHAEQVDMLLFGEGFEVLHAEAGWALGQSKRDGYVGYVVGGALGPPGEAATHRVSALRAYAFREPDIKSTPPRLLSLNAQVCVDAEQGSFARTGAGWIPKAHLAPRGVFEADFVAVAERFLGAPYLWGGRESLGLDCSGLVQAAMYACGRPCPRDADMQAELGVAGAPSALRRGDLVFWPNHVAIVLGGGRIIHANAFHMAVAIEPLDEAMARIAAAGFGPPTAYRRP